MSEKAWVLIIAVVTSLWGLIGIVTRELSAHGLDYLQIAQTRMFIGFITILLILIILRKKVMMIKLKDLWLFVFFGITRVITDVLLFYTQLIIPLGLSTVLQMTATYDILLMSIFVFHEKLNVIKIAALVVGFMGCVFATGALEHSDNVDMWGVVCGLISGLTFAIFIIGMKLLPKKGYDEMSVLFWLLLIGSVTFTPFVDTAGMMNIAITNRDALLWMLIMGVAMTAIPYYLQMRGMSHIEAGKAGLLLPLEVAMAVTAGTFIYNEIMSPMNFIGIVLIVSSITFIGFMNNKKHNDPEREEHTP